MKLTTDIDLVHRYDEMVGNVDPSFYEDDGTNYNDIINMFVRILRHFDDWYWNHYDGDNVVETSLVEDIVDIYKTIEKFYYADKNKTATEIDETLEEQSWRSWLG